MSSNAPLIGCLLHCHLALAILRCLYVATLFMLPSGRFLQACVPYLFAPMPSHACHSWIPCIPPHLTANSLPSCHSYKTSLSSPCLLILLFKRHASLYLLVLLFHCPITIHCVPLTFLHASHYIHSVHYLVPHTAYITLSCYMPLLQGERENQKKSVKENEIEEINNISNEEEKEKRERK